MTLDLDPIKAREAAATPGPWGESPKQPDAVISLAPGATRRGTFDYDYGGAFIGESMLRADRAFVCAARTDVPALLAEVERLRAQLAACPVDHPEPEPPVDCLCGDPDCWDGLA